MSKRVFFLAFAMVLGMVQAQKSVAANTPCSGKKGGISHCTGDKFVCKDGTISASKKTCRS
ncbi:MAG: hypothetical protein Q7J58_17580 [Hydrogenophaga sp.]|uniref:YdcA family protein n=1 Tax=Hydrogenophaga sp. TaxID=1904254 RepID=UPI0027259D05|nr:hypothetical protein [Hydrogenophaga sp.]MDO9571164.1 hypothetical protein [Hydrogenophaga sp.]